MFDIGKFDSTVHVVVFVYCMSKGTATDEIVPGSYATELAGSRSLLTVRAHLS